MRYFIFLSFLCLFSFKAKTQTTISIETQNIGIAFQTDGAKHLKIIYSGKKLLNNKEYALASRANRLSAEDSGTNTMAYTAAGTNNIFVEPAIAVVHADGNNSIDLKYEKHEVTNTTDGAILTTITLKDPNYPFYVNLHFKAWTAQDVIEQWSSIQHSEKGKVILNKYASANLYFFDKNYFLTSYNGTWAKEMQPEFSQLKQGMHSIQTRLGTRENLHTSPNFMLHFDQPASENAGQVMLGQIAWNGNYLVQFETDVYRNMHLVAGINPYQSAYHLAPNTAFETPRLIYTLSFEGIGKGSRNLQNWMRKHNLKDGEGERLTLLNNWEATYFDFDQQKLTGLFQGAKSLGVDMFLLDDGWFGNKHPRNSANAGLGDWQPNSKKLPNGVPYLVKEAEKAGIKFGIWIEPEMVNPKSELYEKHPDWVIKEPNRPEIYFRNQLVLDLSNPEVQNFVFSVVDNLMKENPSLAYFKWDCNAPIFNAHSMYLEKNKIPQSHLYVEYTKGLEKVFKRVKEKYPKLPMMLCSGGGGRSDYNSLQYFTEFWLSDDTDPLERVFIQWDYSYYYPAITMSSHVTDWSNRPIKYKVDVASMGKLGFDIKANELSPTDRAFCQQAIGNYNNFKDIVWHGDMYRLVNPHENDFAALMYVDKSQQKAVLFNYLTNWRFVAEPNQRPIKLQGLDANKAYKITEVNLYNKQKSSIDSSKTYSGDYLMKVGINTSVNTSRSSVVLMIEAI